MAAAPTRRARAAAKLIALCAACGSADEPRETAAAQGGATHEPWSVLLVTLDTTRYDAFGVTGGPAGLTPAFDALARESLLYAQARTVAPLTMPAHASILTGLYPPRHTVRDNNAQILPRGAETLAERARDHGYETAAFVSSIAVDRAFGFDQGFEAWDQPTRALDQSHGPHTEARNASEVGRATATWLAERDRTRPFFVWMHVWDPHAPYVPPAPYLERAGGDPYLGEVAAVDSVLGRMREVLEHTGDWERTLLVIVGDHGEGRGEHGEPTHGTFCWDSTVRVPLLVRYPDGARAGERSDELVSVVDLFPTLCDALGLGAPGDVDGTSLWQREVPADRGVYFESYTGFLYYGWSPLAGWTAARGTYLHGSRPLVWGPARAEGPAALPAPSDAAFVEASKRAIAEVCARTALESERHLDESLLEELRGLGYAGIDTGGPALPNPLAPCDLPSPNDRVAEHVRTLEALNLAAAGDVEGAVALHREILTANPRNLKSMGGLSSLLVARGEYAEAERLLRRMLARGVPAAGVHVNLAHCLLELGQPDEAMLELRAALARDPGHVQALTLVVELLEREGESEELADYRARLERVR